jgi:hypothetical protein
MVTIGNFAMMGKASGWNGPVLLAKWRKGWIVSQEKRGAIVARHNESKQEPFFFL